MNEKKFVKKFRIVVKNDGFVSLWNHELAEALYDKQTGKFYAIDHEDFVESFSAGYSCRIGARKVEVGYMKGNQRGMVEDVRLQLHHVYGGTFREIDIQVLKSASTRAHFVMHV